MNHSLSAILLLAACGSVQRELGPPPPVGSVAVLPFTGPAAPSLRHTARALWQARLAARGYQTAELAWVDQQLAEHGWLADPDRFETVPVPLPELAQSLGVAAIAIGTDFDTTDWNAVLLRREAVAGTVALHRADGVLVAKVAHATGGFGGLVLGSGRVLEELAAQRAQGTPARTAAQLDELVEALVLAMPDPPMRSTQQPPAPVTASAAWEAERLIVHATADPLARLCFAVGDTAAAVPMAPQPGRPGHFAAAIDGAEPRASIVVTARDALGRTTQATVKP